MVDGLLSLVVVRRGLEQHSATQPRDDDCDRLLTVLTDGLTLQGQVQRDSEENCHEMHEHGLLNFLLNLHYFGTL